MSPFISPDLHTDATRESTKKTIATLREKFPDFDTTTTLPVIHTWINQSSLTGKQELIDFLDKHGKDPHPDSKSTIQDIIVLLWRGIEAPETQNKSDARELLFTGVRDLMEDVNRSGNICPAGAVARLLQNLTSVLPYVVVEFEFTDDQIRDAALKIVGTEVKNHLNHLWTNNRTEYKRVTDEIRETKAFDDDLWPVLRTAVSSQMPRDFPAYFQRKDIHEYADALEYLMDDAAVLNVLGSFELSKAEAHDITEAKLARPARRKLDPERSAHLSQSLFGKKQAETVEQKTTPAVSNQEEIKGPAG